MLSKDLELTLNLAFTDAREKRHEYMTVEHLLLALLDNANSVSVLRACGADVESYTVNWLILSKKLAIFCLQKLAK